MAQNILIIGRKQALIDSILDQLQSPEVQFFGGTDLQAVHAAFSQAHIDHIIIGGGLGLETRLDIGREIFTTSMSTKVHMNSPSGPQSFLPFIQSVLKGV